MPQQGSPVQPNQVVSAPPAPSHFDDFDPRADIDLSGIEIIDTSKGGQIDFSEVAYNDIYTFKCLSCGFKYEGKQHLDRCPRCGSEQIEDAE